MKLEISHTTQYTYDAPVSYGLQQVRLTPTSTKHQTVLDWNISISGGVQELEFQDQYQNQTLLVQADAGTTAVSVQVSGVIETHSSDGIFGKIYGKAPLWHFCQSTPRTIPGRGIRKLAKHIKPKGDTLSDLPRIVKGNSCSGALWRSKYICRDQRRRGAEGWRWRLSGPCANLRGCGAGGRHSCALR